ncbi:hypothetical protein CDD81_7071 [Ophiocordyceps australis]|uniref:Carboxypeptidase n=1 Tax=Ophiocordyceps australis TaxID=1399860 RepID=A0A2C5XH72_9HYPO|nr:hypothetical protein CDD81_7071 [Ophiocordyceps australis]
MHVASIARLVLLAGPVAAQFMQPQDATWRNLTVVRSPGDDDVTLSYKEPDGICQTAFDSQKQYTGWVTLPGHYPTNLFFWFVEARQVTDGLTIWLNGGPGYSSLAGLFTGNGPCEVVERGLGRYDTAVREWGWDRASNMLFLDQPNQVGFSFDTPTNGTLSLLNTSFAYPPVDARASWDQLNGTFSTNSPQAAPNTTQAAALAAWHVVQAFMAVIPRSQPRTSPVALSLFAESYGGVYGPIFAETWDAQNQKRRTDAANANATLDLRLTSLGIVNGCVDKLIQTRLLPAFANNNTYGVQLLSDTKADFYRRKFDAHGGCRDLLMQCQALSADKDPDGRGAEPHVDAVCRQALDTCREIEEASYDASRSPFDIAAPTANPQPPLFFVDYLNQETVLATVASPINYTLASGNVTDNFVLTGDGARGGNVARLAALLQRGVRIGFMYGDRDYVCNWKGGEAVAAAVARQVGGEYATRFPAAGYADIHVNKSYVGGQVRQYGNLSFSRIFQAGHSVAWYQPETAFQVFARILLGHSVSTGAAVDLGAYNTTGPRDSTSSADLPKAPKPTCFVRAFDATCDQDARSLASKQSGVVVNGVLYSKSEDWPLASSDKPKASSARKPTWTKTMTGLYTATAASNSAIHGAVRAPCWAVGLVTALAACRAVL